jgi:hypothetical protein
LFIFAGQGYVKEVLKDENNILKFEEVLYGYPPAQSLRLNGSGFRDAKLSSKWKKIKK